MYIFFLKKTCIYQIIILTNWPGCPSGSTSESAHQALPSRSNHAYNFSDSSYCCWDSFLSRVGSVCSDLTKNVWSKCYLYVFSNDGLLFDQKFLRVVCFICELFVDNGITEITLQNKILVVQGSCEGEISIFFRGTLTNCIFTVIGSTLLGWSWSSVLQHFNLFSQMGIVFLSLFTMDGKKTGCEGLPCNSAAIPRL